MKGMVICVLLAVFWAAGSVQTQSLSPKEERDNMMKRQFCDTIGIDSVDIITYTKKFERYVFYKEQVVLIQADSVTRADTTCHFSKDRAKSP